MLLPVCTLISTLTPSRRFFVVSHAILSLQLIVLTVATAVKTSFSLFLLRYTFVKNVFFLNQANLAFSQQMVRASSHKTRLYCFFVDKLPLCSSKNVF